MKNTLANTVGERINEFDSYQTQIVGNFNALFPECPIKGYDVEAHVLIGAPAQGNCREIIVDDDHIVHKMYADELYGIDKQMYHMIEEELNEINGVPV